MRVSLNQIKQYIDFELPPVGELVTRINQQLGGVEEVVDLSARYDGAVIVKVESCEKHPNADKLSVCSVNDGSGEQTQVVCGAPNVHAGMFAVWLKPGSVVPSTADDEEPFVLGARELRGVMSNGMLASPKELGIGDGHDGILEITDQDLHQQKSLVPGTKFAETLGLDDTIIDIENKMFTHRPDLFGQLGVAREIAGIHHEAFKSPDWYATPSVNTPPVAADTLDLAVFNDTQAKVPRFMALVMKDVTVKPSPLWLQCALVALGGKPINNIVDATNYIMLLTAQPTHAYDYDKLNGHKLGARMAKDKETVKLLNGKTYELTTDDIVIADGKAAVGLGGIMGGGESEVSNDTKNIVLEVANFDMYTVRKSSMRHGVFTDALTRFNKGQSPLQNEVVLSHLMKMIERIAGGKPASAVFDESAELKPGGAVSVTVDFINERLGLNLTENEITKLLENVEFEVKPGLKVAAPLWRTDIELPEDIVEEVGRLHGFDKLLRVLPSRSITPAPMNQLRATKELVRSSMKRAGASEVLTYSFVHEKLLQKAGQNKDEAYKLSNALSPELQYYRLSLLPSLLDKVHPNIKNGHDEFVLYELGKAHNKQNVDDDLPAETDLMELVYASKRPTEGAPFFKVRRVIDQLWSDLTIDVSYEAIANNMDYAGAAAFDQTRSALIKTADGNVLGMVGELSAAVHANFKLPDSTAAASLSLEALHAARLSGPSRYSPLSRFPSISQDISLMVKPDISYVDLFNVVENTVQLTADSLDYKLSPISIYAPDDNNSKTITFRLTVTSHDKTLTDNDLRPIIDSIAGDAKQSLGAAVV